nr:toxic anion resistance protein [Luteimonas sp. XNQY3]
MVEKFNTVRNITIASWKRQFAIQLSLGEQKNAVELLRHVHEQLIQTVEEVRSIHRNGMQQRREAEGELARLRDDVQKRLAAPTQADQGR